MTSLRQGYSCTEQWCHEEGSHLLVKEEKPQGNESDQHLDLGCSTSRVWEDNLCFSHPACGISLPQLQHTNTATVFSAHGQSEMTKAEATCPPSSESRTQISVPMLTLTLGCIKQTSECSFMDAASSLGGRRGCWSGNHRPCDRMEIAERKDKVQTSSKDGSEEVSSTRNRFSGTFSLTVLNSRQEKLFHQDNTQSYDLQLNWLATLHIDFSCLGIIFQVSCNSTAPSEQQ